jgi:hypothetical protein
LPPSRGGAAQRLLSSGRSAAPGTNLDTPPRPATCRSAPAEPRRAAGCVPERGRSASQCPLLYLSGAPACSTAILRTLHHPGRASFQLSAATQSAADLRCFIAAAGAGTEELCAAQPGAAHHPLHPPLSRSTAPCLSAEGARVWRQIADKLLLEICAEADEASIRSISDLDDVAAHPVPAPVPLPRLFTHSRICTPHLSAAPSLSSIIAQLTPHDYAAAYAAAFRRQLVHGMSRLRTL